MNTINIFFFSVFAIALTACEKWMEPLPTAKVQDDANMESYKIMFQGVVNYCYELNPWNYVENECLPLDGITDNIAYTDVNSTLQNLATGTLQNTQDIFIAYWKRDYQAIANCNVWLRNRNGFNGIYSRNVLADSTTRVLLQGQAFSLRAWFQFDLLQKFAGESGGKMLGFPIITSPVDITQPNNYPRDTYENCARQIITDCDSALKYLPIVYRDFLYNAPSQLRLKPYLGSILWGRMDGLTVKALKARLYLTWASPAFNTTNNVALWDSAAKYSKQVIDIKMTVDNVAGGFNPKNQINWQDPQSPEIVWAQHYASGTSIIETSLYPGGFLGSGSYGASQELVDAFPMANGYPKNDPGNRGNYDPTKPYENLDPRFYSTIFYNGAIVKRDNGTQVMYTFKTFVGGDDAAGKSNTSRTNYYIKKFIFSGWNGSDQNVQKRIVAKVFFRWTDAVLDFAEAANQVKGPNTPVYGLTAKDAISFLRSRKTTDGLNGLGSTTDPYLNEIAGKPKGEFDAFLRNERRLETCFEGQRIYDLRRWKTSLSDMNKPVHKVEITQSGNSYTYDFSRTLEARKFNSLWFPIPYSEILNVPVLQQNDGWDSWK